ncbi:hypothetical protein MCEREM36_00518 [Candidatus Methylopumilus universalis]|uniref:hypothetical protein n=1 Tax=Candidatus Methylopumilus universalis TaxID=2588536 RepID=UPI003BEEB14F
MKKILAFVFLLSFLNVPLFAAEDLEVKPFHPTDALLIGGNGPFNQGAEYGNDVQVEPDFKPFHPTDALLIGGNGPFNQGAEYSEGK